MGKRFGLFALGWALVLFGGLVAHLVQTSGGVTVRDVRYPGQNGVQFAGLLYVPATATAAHPAPAVLVSHGFINTREMQSPFAIELARRGFVVLAMDMAGHGDSGGVLGADGFGGPPALAYLRGLPFVDKTEIGLEAHSMGGSAIMSAATAMPDAYKSVVLEGSTTAFLGAGREGSPSFPRNLEVVYGQFDEFAPLMWQVAKGADIDRSKRLMAIFGTTTPVVPGKLYGDLSAGTGRELINPAVDHPQEHFSTAGVGAAVDWFQRTLTGAAAPKPPGEQIWFGKELGTLTGFIGCVVLILGTFQLVLATRPFAAARAEPEPAATKRGPRWMLAFVVAAALPALTFYPLMKVAPVVFFAPFAITGTLPFALSTFSEQITNQLAIWALGTGVLSALLALVLRARKTTFPHRWPETLGLAAASVGMGYLALVVVDAVFKVDFRFWVLGLRPLDGRHFGFFLLYLPFFAIFFLLSLRGFCAALPVKGESGRTAVVVGGLSMALGFAVMLAAQYVSMATRGLLLTPDEPLNTIIAFQFVPLLFVIGVIAAFTYRRTGDYAPGAAVCALFVTWYIVAGTAIFPATANAFGPPRPTPARAASSAPAAASISPPASSR
ncbi:MAG TPA: alpha/beta fold hydrolase [Caulobacteraceae bacterium]|nr:alpha/beta fold hydrolase [Caulobacteraceae bacterium]